MRALETRPAPLPEVNAQRGHVAWSLRLRAVTPIYKGGSNPNGVDDGRPFRGASIRGQLRCWWRATVDEADPEELWQRERALFGGVFEGKPVASAVRVSVHRGASETREMPSDEGLRYALWAAERSKHQDARPFHKEGASAELRVSLPEEKADELRRALSAWLLLGGVGSRSRRGLGAVWDPSEALVQAPRDAEALGQQLRELSPPARSRAWASLGGGLLAVGPPERSALEAWKRALAAMQALRSANSDEQLSSLARDFPVIAAGEGALPGARAALGMPLPFQWQREPGGPWLRATMNAAGHNRYPSPVHLRPVPMGRGWAPMMCALRDDAPLQIEAKGPGNQTLRGQLEPKGVTLFMRGLAQRLGWTLIPLEVR